jgi:hypothetical protein
MKAIGLAIIVFALAAAIIPQLTDCAHGGSAGVCHWTAQAALASALPLAVLGGMAGFGKSRSARRSLSILGVILAIFLALLPSALIGVCRSSMMRCNTIMKPSLMMSGIVIAVLCASVFFASRREEKAL